MNAEPQPIRRKFATPGVTALILIAVPGVAVIIYRLVAGLSAVTNLDHQHPWGLWIAIDVATGVALAAGGFTTAAIVHIFHKEQFEALARPALLTALLGYTFVGLGLMVDLGRYYNIWHPAWPTMWQGNSVLFEVGMCVMCYLTVLYIEFLPAVCQRCIGSTNYPRLSRWSVTVKRLVERTMFLFIIAGVVLSCLHQSSLGSLMLIAPTKVHALWFTPILPLLFLLSAVAVGIPMVIFESLYSSWSFGLKPETAILSRLARWVPPILGVYLAFKLGDLVIREKYGLWMEGTVQSLTFTAEVGLGVVLPMFLLLSDRVRRSRAGLLAAALLVVFGVALNRINVFLVSYRPPYATKTYFPSAGEIVVTIALVSILILAYRVIVTWLPVLEPRDEEEAPHLVTRGIE